MLRRRIHHRDHGGHRERSLCVLRDLCGEIAVLATCSQIVLLFALVLTLISCGPPRAERIVVGSKNFTEQAVLGEIIAQQIESRTHLTVERRFYLAGTYICQQAILGGRIDVYPEYTGTALTAILKQPASSDAAQVYDQVRTAYARRFSLIVAPPLGFNNTFALVIRGDDARRDHLKTISQAAAYTPHWRPGFGYEFMERPDGYKGLVKTYGLKFGAEPRIMDLGLLYKALTSQQVDLVAGNSTDGLISALGLTVLEDDRHYFPPYQAVPILRAGTAKQHPEVLNALQELAGKISAEDMQRMNYAVDGQHRDAKDVAAEFLKSHGL
jgi:osmoprotectant transport system substrate-binding protein